jgi:hypothetical protein
MIGGKSVKIYQPSTSRAVSEQETNIRSDVTYKF